MKMIYEGLKKLEKLSLEDYFLEIKFYVGEDKSKKELGLFECYLPLILRVAYYKEAEQLTSLINEQLIGMYKCKIVSSNLHSKIIKNETELKNIIKLAEYRINLSKKGIIRFQNFTPKIEDNSAIVKMDISEQEIGVIELTPFLLKSELEFNIEFNYLDNSKEK